MNKTVSVNINGMIFNIEEQAFEILKKYLDRIRTYLNNAEGSDEVIADIEARIGELFLENINDRKEVINSDDVEKVIGIMGKPEDYIGEEEREQEAYSGTSDKKRKRRLFRDPDNKVIAGVCAGLSNYLGWDPVWLRIILVLLFIFAGFGFLAYIILWIVIPKAETTAEKIQMHGEPVTVENIKKVVDEGIDALLGKDKSHSSHNARSANVRNGLSRFFDAIFGVLRTIVSLFAKFFGAILLFGGMVLLIFMVFALIDPGMFVWGNDHFSDAFTLRGAQDIFVGKTNISSLFYLGLVMIIFSILVAFIYSGLKLLFRIKANSKAMGSGLFVIFIIGVSLTSYCAIKIGNKYSQTETIKSSETLETTDTTLNLMSNEISGERQYYRRQGLSKMEDHKVSMNRVDFSILKNSYDSTIQLEIFKTSNGIDAIDAKERLKNIEYKWKQEGEKVTFDSHMTYIKSGLISDQNVDLLLRLPVGASVYLDESMRSIIDDIQNVHDMYDGHMLNHTWKMTEGGLRCVDCEEYATSESEDQGSEDLDIDNEDLNDSDKDNDQEGNPAPDVDVE